MRTVRKITTMMILVLLLNRSGAQDQQAKSYYRLAVQYKDGNGVPMDYAMAVGYFSKAADLGDDQSIYALAYMHYKGLGCTQDYPLAASLFAKGAFKNRDNSMYFYGLCWRNGYGVAKNEDSAQYWLQKSASLGYKQATQEIQMKTPENSNNYAKELVRQINNPAVSTQPVLNKYNRIENKLSSTEAIAGSYTGYLIQYDWSGQDVVDSKKIILNLSGHDDHLVGAWVVENCDSVALQATLANDSVRFSNTQYRRKDHYSPDSAIRYNFQNARLNLVQKGDSVFLAGNLEMFSPDRKEPSKPLFIALSKASGQLAYKTMDLKVSPNPFTSLLNVEFTLPHTTNVEVQLIAPNGSPVYHNRAGVLGAGHYLLPLQVGYIAPGVYIMKLMYEDKIVSVKVIKQD